MLLRISDGLAWVDLSQGLLVPRELVLLSQSLREAVALLQLDLSGNLLAGTDLFGDGEMDTSGLEALVQSLMVNADKRLLRTLIFSRNNLGREACSALSGLFSAQGPAHLHEMR